MKIKKMVTLTVFLAMCITLASMIGCNVKNAEILSERTMSANVNKDDPDYDLQASNSIGNYISQRVKNETESSAASLEGYEGYAISDLTFEPDTGTVLVKTSQTNACKVSVRFLTDDGSTEILKAESSVNAGSDVVTQIEAETVFLPQYYQVTAELLGPMGEKLCDTYICNEFTQNMQEIYAADIYDFEPEYVVNLDDDPTTNFMVLSEEAVIAESSESVNNLVSADYESRVFVFDNVDETIRSLEENDFLYVKADEENTIAISVASVEFENNTATIIENGNDIDDMFEFIKIKETANTSDAIIDTSESDEDVKYLGFDDSDDTQSFDLFSPKMKAAIAPSSFDIPGISGNKGITVGGEGKAGLGPVSFEVGFKTDDKNFSITGKVNVGIDVSLNFYKKKDYCSVKLLVETPISAEVTATLTTSLLPEATTTTDSSSSSSPSESNKPSKINKETGLAKWSISIGAFANLVLEPKFCFEASLSASFTAKYTNTPKYGFSYDTINGKSDISENGLDSDNIQLTGKVEATAFIGMKFEPSLEDKLGGKLLKVSLSAKAGIQLKASVSTTGKIDPDKGEITTTSNGLIAGMIDESEDTFHFCEWCVDGDINFIFNASATVKLLPEIKKLKLEYTVKIVDLSIKLSDFYYSPDAGFGWGPCPNLLYRTKFCLNELNNGQKTPIQKAYLTINNVSDETNSEGKSAFYCSNGTYKYEIYIDNEKVDEGTFIIYNAKKTYNIDFEVTEDASGGKSYNASSGKIEETTAVTTTTTTITTTTTTEKFVKDELAIVESGQLGEEVYYLIYGDGFMYIYGNGSMDDYSSSIENKALVKEVSIENFDGDEGITNIGSDVFSGCENMTSIELPETITYIGDYAFRDCDGLTDIKIPDSVTSIGNCAFKNCNNLVSVSIPNTEEIGSDAFRNCDKLSEINIGKGVKTIGSEAFSSCTSLKELVIPENVEEMGTSMLYGCCALEKLTIPYASTNKAYTDGTGNSDWSTQVSDLFDYSWSEDCAISRDVYAIRTIAVTRGECIPSDAFYGMNMLKEIVLPETITYIGDSAFDNCDGLTDIKIPDSVTSIGDYSFSDCDGLTDIKIPDSVTSMGSRAFEYCNNLKKITILNPNCEIDDSAHTIASNATIYGYYNSTARAYAEKYGRDFISLDEPTTSTTTTTITNTTTSTTTTTSKNTTTTTTSKATTTTEATATTSRTTTTETVTTTSKTTITTETTTTTSKITTTTETVTTTSKIITTTGTMTTTFKTTTTTETTATISKTTTTTETTATISKTTTTTETTATTSKTTTTTGTMTTTSKATTTSESTTTTSVTTITETSTTPSIPEIDFTYDAADEDYVVISKYIGSAAEVVIPSEIDGVPVKQIGKGTFSECTDLTIVNIPDSVVIIEENAFEGCSGLTSIVIPDSVVKVESNAFDKCENLVSITIKNPDCEIENLGDALSEIVVIYGYNSSTAQNYAEKNNVKFVSLDDIIVTTTTSSTSTTTKTTTTTSNTSTSTNTTTTMSSTTTKVTTTTTKTITVTGTTATKTKPNETTTTVNLGDVDSNGTIDALDASLVLTSYAMKATGQTPNLDSDHLKAADVNHDGNVDALDASLILGYYAYKATGGHGSLNEFLNK